MDNEAETFAYWRKSFPELLNPARWVEAADILVAALSFMRSPLEMALKQLKERRAGEELPADYMLPHLTLYTGPVFLMLAGFALENLFKAHIVLTHPELFQKRGSPKTESSGATSRRDLPDFLLSHNLVTLAAKTPIRLSKVEKNLLRHLTAAAVWWGRYPVPKSHRDMLYQREDGSCVPTQGFSDTAMAEATGLFKRTRAELFPTWSNFLEIHGMDPLRLGIPRTPLGPRVIPPQKS